MAINPVKTPFTNMSFTPDVPSQALGPQEYNNGYNIETDVRSIRSVLGEEYILSTIPGNQIYSTGGFRGDDQFTFVVANTDGDWYATTGTYGGTYAYSNIATPTANTYIAGYNITSQLTDCWNGEILFINDNQNPPMYLLPNETRFRLYDTAYAGQTSAPGNVYVWNYDTAPLTGGNVTVGNVTYQNGDDVKAYSSLTAAFMRLYASPNVGSILVAGNFSATLANTTQLGTAGTDVNYPTQVRWSNSFGLDSPPPSWDPFASPSADGTSISNALEVPVRGPLIDGFPHNGNFYLCSYWDTVALSPIAYQSTLAPVFGVKIINIGRGLLNENCWANADDVVYGLDARDIWVFNGGSFKSLGNQRVKDWFYSQLNHAYLNATVMVNNTAKNQIEIYFADQDSDGYANQMLSYRYDLDIWNAPREVANAIHAVESPRWEGNLAQLSTRCVVYSQGGVSNQRLIQKDIGTSFIGNVAISTLFERDNINFGQPYSQKVQVHRVLPEVTGQGNVNITIGGADSVGANIIYKPTIDFEIDTDSPWCQIDQNDVRTVSVKVDHSSNVASWEMSAINWQITVVEDSR